MVTVKISQGTHAVDVKDYFKRWSVPVSLANLASRPVTHWVGGEAITFGNAIDVYEPSTGLVVAQTFEAGSEIVDMAVSAARNALDGEWSRLRPLERQGLLLKLADLLIKHQDELAFLETVDAGKLRHQSYSIDIGQAIEVLQYFAGWATKISGRTGAMTAYDQTFLGLTLKKPVGVVAAIAPWNFPFQTLVWKIAAAFAAGCTVVAKPSEVTPIGALRLAELVSEAGFPNGVFNVVNGTGAITGAALVSHPGVNKVSFTGSTATGKVVGTSAIANMTRLTLELGGKSPALVFADSDIDLVVEGLFNGIFFNTGQICDASSRAIVDKRIADEVLGRLVDKAAAVTIGPGLDPQSTMGPLVSAAHRAKVLSFVDRANQDNLKFAIDRSGGHGEGNFVGPVIIENPPLDHPVWLDEIFGPFLTFTIADGPDDIIRLARDTKYGLGAAIYSRNIGTVLGAANKIDAGTIYVNGHGFLDPAFPFGGFGLSGMGKDLGAEQMEHFLETKSLLISSIEL